MLFSKSAARNMRFKCPPDHVWNKHRGICLHFIMTLWNCIKYNSFIWCMFDTAYIWYSVSPLFWKPGNRNRSQGRMRPSDPFASSFPGFSFSSSFGFGNGFGSDPFGSNRYGKCFPDFWHLATLPAESAQGRKG